MEKHFNFGHTILQEEESSEDLQNLFKIGGQQISLSDRQRMEDSSERVKEKKIKKHKKEHKDKQKKHKEKKDKNEKGRQKKQKRQKKHRDNKSSSSQLPYHPIEVYHPKERVELYQKYSKIFESKSVDQMLTHKFELNIKLGEGCLNVDVMSLGQKRLYEYGLMDKQIPQYKRLGNECIMGMENSRHAKKIIRQLNQVINQKNIRINEDQISCNRYFHFEGYQHVGLETLAPHKHQTTSQLLLPFNQNSQGVSEEQDMLRMAREINRRLNENPQDIDLWMEFLQLQDTFPVWSGSLKNRAAVIDRKISIVQKSLQFNKLNQRLGTIYLSLLLEREQDLKEICRKCLQFVRANPSSKALWKLYFRLTIHQFSIYSHPSIRIAFEEITRQFKVIIDKTKSALEIWKIRKASLEMVRLLIHIYKLEGYGQLATGTIIALIQFNLFMSEQAIKSTRLEQKLQLFKTYWEDNSINKLGQTPSGHSWCCIGAGGCPNQFIGAYHTTKPKEGNPIMQQMMQSQRLWRMSNSRHDQSIIQKYPESFIFYEDVDFTLMLYRDNQSLTTLIDILADHLELPTLFSATSTSSQFIFKVVESRLRSMVKNNDYSSQYLGFKGKSYWWGKFWDPQYTQLLIPQPNWLKIQYLRRILVAAKPKLPPHQSAINQYLAFIICSISLSAKLQQCLGMSSSRCMEYLSEIMDEQPLNVGVWSIYIQSTYIKTSNQKECIQCFLQLFQTITLHSHTHLTIEILYWLSQFSRLHGLTIAHFIIKKFKQICFSEADEVTDVEVKLCSFDCLLIEQYLMKQVDKIVTGQHPKLFDINGHKVVLFLLYYLEQFPYSQLVSLKPAVTCFLIQLISSLTCSNQQLLLLHVLLSYRLVTLQHINDALLLKTAPHISLIQYWVSLLPKPFLIFQSQFQGGPCKSLVIWMISCIFRSKNCIILQHFYQHFITYAKKACFQDGLNEQNPSYITLLNELLIYDVQQHSKFIAFSLHHLPFSKPLYLLNAISAQNEQERRKIFTLIHQKGIRILNPTIISK